MTNQSGHPVNSISQLKLSPQTKPEPTIVLPDKTDYSKGDFQAYFYVSPNDYDEFLVYIKSKPYHEVFSINGTAINDHMPHPIRSGDHIRLFNIDYDARIDISDVTFSRGLLRAGVYTQTSLGIDQARYEEQQDAAGFFVYQDENHKKQQGLWIVADGVTNASFGSIASQYAVKYIMWHYFHNAEKDSGRRLQQAIVNASDNLINWGKRVAQQNGEEHPRRCATTVAAIALTQMNSHQVWDIALVGDSKVYMASFDEHMKNYNTKYFSADSHFHDNVLEYAVGKKGLTEHDVHMAQISNPSNPEFIILLATDGVWKQLEYPELCELLENGLRAPSDQPDKWQQLPAFLIDRAVHQYGGYDNATALVIKTGIQPSPLPTYDITNPQVCLDIGAEPVLPEPEVENKPTNPGGIFGRIFKKR